MAKESGDNTEMPAAPARSTRRADGTVDWAAAGRKAWETRRRNAAARQAHTDE